MRIFLSAIVPICMLVACDIQTAKQDTPELVVMQQMDANDAVKNNLIQNKQLVTNFFTHFSAGDIDTAFNMVSDNASWWVPGDLPFSGTKTKAEYMQVVGSIQKGFPSGLALNPTAMIAQGNQVAVEVTSNGQHMNGKTYANEYHFLITIEDGKIIAVKEYMDTLHLYQLIQP